MKNTCHICGERPKENNYSPCNSRHCRAASNMVCTSVQDGLYSVRSSTNTKALCLALSYERDHCARKGMVTAIQRRLRKLDPIRFKTK